MIKFNRQYNLNDIILFVCAKKLGYKCKFITNNDRWMIFSNKDQPLFTTYGLRFPIDTPYQIEHANNKLLEKAKLKSSILPFISFKIKLLEELGDGDVINNCCVMKTIDGMKGKGVYTKVTKTSFKYFANLLKKFGEYCILEPYIEGKKYRVLILDGKVLGLHINNPPKLVGDGKHTILQLFSEFREKILNYIHRLELDEENIYTINQQGYDINEILPNGVSIKLTNTINVSRGASFERLNIDGDEYKDILDIALKATHAVNLAFCGVDLIRGCDGKIYILECNPSPDISIFTFYWCEEYTLEVVDLEIPIKIINKVIENLHSHVKVNWLRETKFDIQHFNSLIQKLGFIHE